MKCDLRLFLFATLISSAGIFIGCTPLATVSTSAGTALPTSVGVSVQTPSPAFSPTILPSPTGSQPTETEMPVASPPVVTPVQSPTLAPANHSITELKYLLIDRYNKIFFCDPDFYPVAHEVSDQEIARRVAALRQNAQEYDAIVKRLGLQGVTNPSPAQNRLMDAESKRLNAIQLQPLAQGYSFQLQTSEDGKRGLAVAGTISADGIITVTQQQPTLTACPICLTGSTRIDTPQGGVAVQDLQQGMSVWTVGPSGQRERAVIIRTVRRAVPIGALIVHAVLADGRELFVSAGHPTMDGQPIGDLRAGDMLDGARVISLNWTPLEEGATYDILPSGNTGAYWANGILLASTLASLPQEKK